MCVCVFVKEREKVLACNKEREREREIVSKHCSPICFLAISSGSFRFFSRAKLKQFLPKNIKNEQLINESLNFEKVVKKDSEIFLD